MFGRWKWLAAVVAYVPLLLFPVGIVFWVWPTSVVADAPPMRMLARNLVVVWSLAGAVWFLILIARHPRMDRAARIWRAVFLFLFYPITAPFVFHALAHDPNARPEKILKLDDQLA